MTGSPFQAIPCGVYVIGSGLIDSHLENKVFNSPSGTGVALLVKSSDKSLVKIEDSQSTMDQFVDNTGKDMLKTLTGEPIMSRWLSPTIQSPFTSAIAEFSTRATPDLAATKINLRGTIRAWMSEGEDIRELKDYTFVLGPLGFDGKDISIVHIGPSTINEGCSFSVKFRLRGVTRDLINYINIVDSEGEPLSFIGGFTEAPDGIYIENCLIAQIQSATIRIGFWKNLEIVDLPFEGEVGLGIPVIEI